MTDGGSLRLAGLVSGGGRTMVNLLDHIERGALAARIEVVIASRGDCGAVEALRRRGVRVEVVSRAEALHETAMHDRIDDLLREADVELVCLAGYLRRFRVTGGSAGDWLGRAINIHPALLPEFGGLGMFGMRVHEAVIASGQRESGCTVHFVDAIYDHGPIILQRRCPVLPHDTAETLAARVFEEECRAYPEAVNLLASGRIRWLDGRVHDASAPEILDERRG